MASVRGRRMARLPSAAPFSTSHKAPLKHDVQRPDITAVEKDVIVIEYAGQLLGRDLCISVDRAVSQRQRLRGGVILEAAGRIVSAAYRALCDVENGAAEALGEAKILLSWRNHDEKKIS